MVPQSIAGSPLCEDFRHPVPQAYSSFLPISPPPRAFPFDLLMPPPPRVSQSVQGATGDYSSDRSMLHYPFTSVGNVTRRRSRRACRDRENGNCEGFGSFTRKLRGMFQSVNREVTRRKPSPAVFLLETVDHPLCPHHDCLGYEFLPPQR